MSAIIFLWLGRATVGIYLGMAICCALRGAWQSAATAALFAASNAVISCWR